MLIYDYLNSYFQLRPTSLLLPLRFTIKIRNIIISPSNWQSIWKSVSLFLCDILQRSFCYVLCYINNNNNNNQWALQSMMNLGLCFTVFQPYTQSVGLVGCGSARRKAISYTGQHKQRINIHALSGIRTHDSSVWADEDSPCLRPLGYCDRHYVTLQLLFCAELLTVKLLVIWYSLGAKLQYFRNSYRHNNSPPPAA
jgi:hypothetical protein